ncbi:GTPase-activating protein GYP5 [Grifola frondosa]|uniref:GTPase-activating protein GYP5 n=1 Tax=Grifola frondosa TaxID=5627 RepID=A0A1C7LP92_GRIFR|nr:GTPase-activating protein GYP5 [Grifola frondosa]
MSSAMISESEEQYAAEEDSKTPTPLSTSNDQFASATSPLDSLDSLLSPTSPHASFPVRESVAASDVTDDDARFSTVPLSARQSLASTGTVDMHESQLQTVEEGPNTGDDVTLVDDARQHKKSASTSTILSASNVPFLLSRLSLENTADGDEGGSRRSSVSVKLQEELGRKHGDEEAVDWDFWGSVVSDYQTFASQHPEELAKAIERGIPKTLRGMIWQLMSASKDPELENTYVRLLKEVSSHEKAISRDLGRTFPHHAFFTDGHGIGQENLFNVLKAYSLYDPQVGYCQGLPFVVAILLLNMPDEEAFCLLVRLMHSYDLRGHFLPEMPKLQLRLVVPVRTLDGGNAPVLHVHFLRQGIKSSMYCSQWFLTMFSYRFPIDIVFRVYDNCLASGIEAMFAFSLALLIKNEDALLSLKFDELLAFLNTRMFEVYQLESAEHTAEGEPKQAYKVDEFVQDAVSLKITPFMLDTYAHEYDELVRARDAHRIEMDALRNTNRMLSSQVYVAAP